MHSDDTTPSDNPVASKRCNKCERELPLTGFYRDKNKRDGRQSQCRECTSKRHRQWLLDNRERANEYQRRYRQENKDKVAEYVRRYRQENKDKIAEGDRQYRRKNKDKIDEYKRQYYQENKGKINDIVRKYRQENKGKIRVQTQNRRARERGNGGAITAKQWQSVLDRFDGKCAKCGSAENIHMDHVVPLAKGGRHDVSNVQPLCATCNLRKGTKVEDYRGRMYQPLSLLIDEDAA